MWKTLNTEDFVIYQIILMVIIIIKYSLKAAVSFLPIVRIKIIETTVVIIIAHNQEQTILETLSKLPWK